MSKILEKKVNEHDSLLKEISYSILRLERYNEESEKFNRKFKQEMREFKDEMKDFKTEINKKWGELANKLGTVVEDIVVPNIPYIAEKYFNLKDCDILQVRVLKRMPSDKSKQKEFDIIAVYDDTIIYNETKETPRQQYIKEFIEFIENNEFFKYFPEYSGKKLIPVISTLYMPDNIITYLTKNNIYALAMKENTMDILNFEEIKV